MRYLLLLLLSLLGTAVLAQVKSDGLRVTFRLHAPSLPDTAQVYLTGSTPELGEWNPARVLLDYNGDKTWTKTLQLQDSAVQYKYTLGSWERQGTDTNGQPLPNFSISIHKDTIVTDEVQYWLEQRGRKVTGGVTGELRYHRDVAGKGLQNRDLVVWLPPGYEHGKKRYPVLYMHDGQNIFDPATSSFGVDWQVDETADSLIRKGEIAPVIIVGINNTADRMEEYTPGEKGTAYMDFVLHTVKPLIDQTYRTKPGPKHTLVGGSSAGGTISFMLAWEHPDVFSKAICMSPAFQIMHIDYVQEVQNYAGEKKKLFLYIDNGGIELEAKLQPGIDAMLQALQQKGYRPGKDYYWVKDPKAPHFESAWAKRMPLALKLCLGRKGK
ncbi:alpha/beta hydrolase-fold protein [Pontibacter roseus]|uniref:alpha/beta hydrolase-fold protein n=1 Tax=Pontibacter roseus TaxID=336989 RepID=UPI00036AF99B|nr:alpha/beta hydrolase-fold protein [Pontibacter roseus]